MLSSQVKKIEQESEELQARAMEWKARHDRIEVEVQRQREAFERRIDDLEIVNQLQQERYVSFTDCVSCHHVARPVCSIQRCEE